MTLALRILPTFATARCSRNGWRNTRKTCCASSRIRARELERIHPAIEGEARKVRDARPGTEHQCLAAVVLVCETFEHGIGAEHEAARRGHEGRFKAGPGIGRRGSSISGI